jgi:hypothetical protein
MESYIHEPALALPPLVRIALIHAQFETIHPFLDGNGRMGRLLIAALLEDWKLLPEPLLYVSGQLKTHQAEYYRLLSTIRTEGDWESCSLLPRLHDRGGRERPAQHHRHRFADRCRSQKGHGCEGRHGAGYSPIRNAADDAALHHQIRC